MRWYWFFLKFKSECERNAFGLDCKELCSGHCNNNEPCDHVSGVCSGGCQNGYIGARCFNCKMRISLLKWYFKYNSVFIKVYLLLLASNAGYYGTNCSIPCSPNCNGTCEHIDGSCDDYKAGSESHCSKGSYTWENV